MTLWPAKLLPSLRRDQTESLREIIICATAREIRSQYEFYAHARLAREAGVPVEPEMGVACGLPRIECKYK